MARQFEIWEFVDDGMELHQCNEAGPRGNGARSLLPPDAKLLTVFEATSHFDAMTTYHRFLGRELYTTDQQQDYDPFPMEPNAE